MLLDSDSYHKRITLYIGHGKVHNFSCDALMPHIAFFYDDW